MSTRRLVIDIGTNSVLALLADVSIDGLTVISDRKQTTRLGEGLSASGYLRQSAMIRTARAVTLFCKEALYDELFMIGTEALRLAKNSSEFLQMVMDSVGQPPTIISGLKEAELTFLGARFNLKIDGKMILLIDVGGGSTELVVIRGETIADSISIPIGALKLKEIAAGGLKNYLDKATKILEEGITSLQYAKPDAVLATGGTITSVAAIKLGENRYDSKSVHGSILSIEDMRRIASQFDGSDKEGRVRMIPFDPERAELILPGLGIFLSIMGITNQKMLMVSAGGLRYGAALRPDKILP